jgi:hypothetical protein
MEIRTGNLILRSVDDSDINEVARMWDFEKGEISLEDAKEAIDWMAENHRKNDDAHFIIYASPYSRRTIPELLDGVDLMDEITGE